MNRRLAWAMVGVALVTAVWCAPGAWARATYGARTTADEPQYLMTALSLAEDGNLDVRDERADGRYRAFHKVGLPLQEAARADGTRVSPHDPLLPALLAGPMALGGWLAAKLALAVLAGVLAAALLWVAVVRFAVRLEVGVLTVLAFTLAAPLAIYSTQVYPELAAALAVTVGVGALTGPLRRAGVVALLAAVIALPWLSVKYAPVAGALAMIAVVQLARRETRPETRRALAVVGVCVAAGVVFVLLHQAWYGGWTPYASGRHFVGGETTVMGSNPDYVGRSVRLVGLLNDRGFGLAAWAPVFLLAIPALATLARRRPPGGAAVAIVLAVGWCNATFVALTMHGWWSPGRQVVVVVPCIVFSVAWWAQHVPAARYAVAILGALGAITAAWLVGDVLAGHMTLIVDFERTTNPLYRAWRLVLPDGRVSSSSTVALRVAWLGAVGLLGYAGWRSVGHATSSRFIPSLTRRTPTCASS